MELSVHTGKGTDSSRKRERQSPSSSLSNTNDPFGHDLEEEEPHDDFAVPQKAANVTKWKDNQNAAYWVRLSKAQSQGLEFWQTKSFAIMTYATIFGEYLEIVLTV